MSVLRKTFEERGFGRVSTYIQSGNVIFESDDARETLEDAIETMLAEQVGVPVMVVVRSRTQIRNVVHRAPPGFGSRPDEFHSDTVFLKKPLTPAQTMKVVEVREGVDRAWPGAGVVYLRRLSARRSQSKMSRIMSTPEYALMTIRSWRTTTRLFELLEGD